MPRSSPDPFSPYAGTTNLERSRSILTTEPLDQSGPHPPGLTIVVLNLDHPELLVPLLSAVEELTSSLATRGLGTEVLIGDTGSTDTQVLAAYDGAAPNVVVREGLDYHFSANNNLLVRNAPTGFDTVLLLNNDVIVADSAPINAMLEQLADPGTGIVGLRLVFPDGTVQHDGVEVVTQGFRRGMPWHPGRGDRYQPGPAHYPAPAVTGACLMIRRSLWDTLGGLDESFEKECQDVDLCFAARRLGWGVVVVDSGPVVHLENATRSTEDGSIQDRRRFLRRWATFADAVTP